MGLDTEWALEQCREWLRLNERVPIEYDGERKPGEPKTRVRGSKEERGRISDRVRWIAYALYGESRGYPSRADGVRSLIFELEEGLEVRERLGLEVPAPSLEADAMHPWVWRAAAPHWDSGNHDAAVWAAAINVNTMLKEKARRPDLGESKLVSAAFGKAPPEPGQVRLRLCDSSCRQRSNLRPMRRSKMRPPVRAV